ncbi:MAG: hypothetical protein JJ896_00290 [Rhodothermales bacterium]|nr:hypothetical protein [Rhodothermales bacterium]MBO6778064.1 hypothetical protein [Rhodothermales bacterium]
MPRLLCLALFAFSLTANAQPLPDSFLDGLEFREIGPATMSGRVVDLAVQVDDPYTFYVASATGGVWKTTNNGVTFEAQFQNEAVHSIGDIALHAIADSILWVGTGERANRQSSSWGNGVYRSTDGGKTFTHLGLDETRHVGRIALHPSDPDVAWVAGMGHLWGPNPERGLYKTSDGGATWERLLFVDDETGVVDVAVDHTNPDILYAATYQRQRRAYGFHGGGPGSGLHKSTDGGRTWREMRNGLPEGDFGRIGIALWEADPSVITISVEQGWQYNASTAYGERRAGVYRSEDRGETWTFMSDWNPRPMYASQPYMDPSDDQRIYMQNSFSWSDDGGRTFTRARQSLHGDDRIVWVNPADSRHVIKGDDGGIGISYDRALTWLYVTSLPIAQFYRVDVDMRDPYWVYGGLQDNGSWAGPSETYRNRGILNEDWIKTGGGDGFVNHVSRSDPDRLYTESQYLGLSMLDLGTGERRSIRPGDPQGRIGPRRNWTSWGPGVPEPELGNAMAPANWDGPFVLSAHHPETIYAATNIFWRSRDGGDTWEALGDLTTGTDRRYMTIMGQVPHDSTLSLDDGIPYWPTIASIAESPLDADFLLAGTDDGLLHVSHDAGATWTDVTERLPGAPDDLWVAGIEASRHAAGTAYVVVNNYRNDDYGNYLYVTDDAGETWRSITTGLPHGRVLRTLREDPREPNALYLGAEIGLFVSVDRGETWTEWTANLPTAAVNDLVVHPRDNDLVLGTHGRGIWILDDLGPIQAAARGDASPLFEPPTARMIRYRSERGHAGDMIFYGQNPARGALITYQLARGVSASDVALDILGLDGSHVRSLRVDTSAGMHRTTWNFRHEDLAPAPADTTGGRAGRTGFAPSGPMALPGQYRVRLTLAGEVFEQPLTVMEDPRLEVDPAVRSDWTETQFAIGDLWNTVARDAEFVVHTEAYLSSLGDAVRASSERSEIAELSRKYQELMSRVRSLYGQVGGWTGPMTADQESMFAYYSEMLGRLAEQAGMMRTRWLPRVNRGLPRAMRLQVP